MQPIRILHVFGGLDSGGAESRTMDIYRRIDKSKVQFDFLIHTSKKGFYEDEIKNMGGLVHRVSRLQFKTILTYPKELYEFFNKNSEYKIIHGHMVSTAFIYLIIAKYKGVTTRIAHSRSGGSAQSDIITKIKNFTNKLSRFNTTHMFAVSRIAAISKFGKKNVELNKVKVIPNAINSKKFKFDKNIRKEMKKELDLKTNIVIGHIGRMTPQKNHLYLLDVFNNIVKKLPEAKLILIGNGPQKEHIINKISDLGLEKDVKLLGVRDDVEKLYQAMDVFLFPSTHEGLPGVILEAQASGLPCIISSSITDEVKITDLVEYVSLKKDKAIWADKTLKLINKTSREHKYKEIIQAGYDIETVAKKYEEFYLTKHITQYNL